MTTLKDNNLDTLKFFEEWREKNKNPKLDQPKRFLDKLRRPFKTSKENMTQHTGLSEHR
jgi:hypothetical protein